MNKKYKMILMLLIVILAISSFFLIKEIAENYVNESWRSYLDLDEVDLVMAGIGVGKIIASEQEKQIQIDAEQIRALQKQNGELTDKVKELEAQVEKVKHYLDYDIPHDLINEATTKIWRMLK